ncbi:TPA: hypothetical protein DCY43_01675 [candidate division WWE3 bacterium]|uniref:Uncharacterized protein n=2 Tax=Katanobacteria TaxID=422282 RepID=A0A0G1KHY8_UNCKA|nr:MAG: hypothetical protein UW82_C0046G0006 [candidate division WWE3 bacterium GW2011_GWC2_44_9]HAZ29447.1 hypothetical protein [candidate division WWE3 bacterium]
MKISKSPQKGNVLVILLVALTSLILGVTGAYLYLSKSRTVTPTDTTKAETATTNWKIYPPESYKLPYSFKYPSDVDVTEAQTLVYLKSGESTLYHSFFGKAKDIDSLMKDYQPFGAPKVVFSSRTAVSYGDLTGYKALNSGGNSIYYFLEKKPSNFVLMFSHETADKVAEDLFKKIISTVSFNQVSSV